MELVFGEGMGLLGLWIGPLCGSLVEFLWYAYVLRYKINWEKVTLEVSERLKNFYDKTILVQ